jgi:hypothetical protein
MTAAKEQNMTEIARAYSIIVKQGLLWKKKPRVEIPKLSPHAELFLCGKEPDGTPRIARTAYSELSDLSSLSLDTLVVYVQTERHSLPLDFVEVVRDEKGYPWGLAMDSSVSIVDSQRFLRSCALAFLSPDLPVTREMFQTWIVTSVISRVKDEVRQAMDKHGSLDAIRQQEVLPARWWGRQLLLWVQDCGVDIQVLKVTWNSTEAAKAEVAHKRSEQLAAIAREQEATHQAELRQMRLKEAYEQEKARIETNATWSKKQQEQELTLLELKHKKELIQAETEIENLQWAAKNSAKEYEVMIAELDNKLHGIQQQAPEQWKKAEEAHKTTLEMLTKATEMLERLEDLDILKFLAQEKERHQSIEDLLSEKYGFMAESVAILGYQSSDGQFLERIREKARRDAGLTTIRKTDLHSRSIQTIRFTRGLARDVSTAEIQHLPINGSLQFEFFTRRSGLVTLLNIGTSGLIYVHVPNAFVGARAARAQAQAKYEVPGPEFLPWNEIKYYYEAGPGGWEHMALLLSDEPLIEHGIVLRSTPRNPLVRLSQDEVDGLCEKLETMKPESWTGTVLSFRVTE